MEIKENWAPQEAIFREGYKGLSTYDVWILAFQKTMNCEMVNYEAVNYEDPLYFEAPITYPKNLF